MAKKSLKPVVEKIEGSFLDVSIPQFDWIKIDLTHNKTNWIDSKTENIEKVEDNYNIVINLSEKILSEDKDFSSKIKEIFHLNFAPYYWREKSYRFYTTDKTGNIEQKKEILTNLMSFLKAYENDKSNQFNESSELFKEDAKSKIKLESVDLLMKFHEPSQRFVVLAKDFLGSEKFALLKKCSEYSSKLISNTETSNENKLLITTDFFEQDLPGKKLEGKTYFFINSRFYEEIKHHFNVEASKEKEFLENQKKISLEKNLSEFNIESENVFGLKVKFIEEHQCFEFYGKGYFESQPYNGRYQLRSLIGLWALNFIYSKDIEEENYHSNEMIVNKNKIELQEIKGGSKREKNIRIPASEWPKIKEIKENFEKEMALWGRETKSIKISHCYFDNLSIFERFPAVYFNNKGESFFVYGSRRTGVFKNIAESAFDNVWFDDVPNVNLPSDEKKKNVKFSQTLKSIPISFEEAKFFINEHPFADQIKKGTIELNARIHAPLNQLSFTVEEKNKIFDTVYLYAEINNQNKEVVKTKTRKMKI